jgi:hypothetical protein
MRTAVLLAGIASARGVKVGGGSSTSARFCVEANLDVTNFYPEKGAHILLNDLNPACPLSLVQGALHDGVAWGTYTDTIDTNGWSELQITTHDDDSISNDVKMFAAGFLEGILTYTRISEFYHNQRSLLLRDEKSHGSLSNVKNLFKQEILFMNVESNLVPHVMDTPPQNDYGKQVRYLVFQLYGVMDGYNHAAKINGVHQLEIMDMVALNSLSEWPTLMDAYTNLAIRKRAEAAPIYLQMGSSRSRTSSRSSSR